MYSSKDMVNWTFVDKIVANGEHEFTYSDGSKGTLGSNRMIERPKLLFCERTGQYVVWCHWEAGNYGASEAAVFYADDVEGPYTIHWAGRPMGVKSRDCNVFQDNDGNAYFVSTTSENTNLGVFKLSDDYLDAVSHDVILAGQRREAPAIVRIGDTYHMLSSACSGWDPNRCQYHHSTSLIAGWSGATNLNNGYSYDTQAASILDINGTYLYVGDRWQDPDLAESKTIIFPISFNGTSCTFEYSPQFDVNLMTGEIRETALSDRVPRDNWTMIDCSSAHGGHEVEKAFDSNLKTHWHSNWNTGKTPPHHFAVDMGDEYEVSGFAAIPRLDNDVNGLIRNFILYVSNEKEKNEEGGEGEVKWTAVAAGGWLPYGGEVYFQPVKARYFKLVSLTGEYASVSEIEMLTNTAPYTPMAMSGNNWITAEPGSDVVFHTTSESTQGSWGMVGPNGFVATQTYMNTADKATLTNVSPEDVGVYRAFYLNAYNQISTLDYTLRMASDVKQYTVTINVGDGIVMSGMGAGQYMIDEGDNISLNFSLADSNAKADVLFKVNGETSTFKQTGGNMSYLIGSVDKDYTIDIALSQYIVTVPELKGAVIDPAPGAYPVAYGEPFRFTVTLVDDDRDLSEIRVYINDELIEPIPLRALAFMCEIKKVTGPITIRIEDATATSNIGVAGEKIKLTAVNGQLIIETGRQEAVQVYTLAGTLVASRQVNGHATISLPTGVYIIRTTEGNYKYIVR